MRWTFCYKSLHNITFSSPIKNVFLLSWVIYYPLRIKKNPDPNIAKTEGNEFIILPLISDQLNLASDFEKRLKSEGL
jgi:hypothetical protein